MTRLVPGPEVEVRLLHHVSSDYNPSFALHRLRAEPFVVERPPSSLVSAPVVLTCATCHDRVEFQVLSVLAARLRWGLWIVLTGAGLALIGLGLATVIRAGTADPAEPTQIVAGILITALFGTFWATEFGVSGMGTRFTFRPHGLRRQGRADRRQEGT